MQVFWYIIIALGSFVVGVIARYIYEKSKKQVTDGTLKYSVDPDDGIYFFVEFPDENAPARLLHKKHAIFKVDTSDIISHK